MGFNRLWSNHEDKKDDIMKLETVAEHFLIRYTENSDYIKDWKKQDASCKLIENLNTKIISKPFFVV